MIQIPPPEAVQQLFPSFRDVRQISSGGYKVVYRVETDQSVEALKLVYIPDFADRSSEERALRLHEAFGRVQREINTLARCTGPELVKLGEMTAHIVQIDSASYVAYTEEYISGNNLQDLIQSRTVAPTEDEARLLFVTLLKAIKELTAINIIHRDIKPKNIMKLGELSRPFVLLDLGVAYAIDETPLTANPYEAQGTLPYMAPEMFNPDSHDHIDYRSDLYSAGVTVYEYAAGKHPIAHDSDSQGKAISRIRRQSAIPLKSVRPDFSNELCGVIDLMLKKQPNLRPSNLDGLLAKFQR